MNSYWNGNFIIFTMALVSSHSGSQIKIRVFGPTRIDFESNLVKVVKNLQEAQV